MFQNKVVRSITNCFGLLEFFHGSNNMNYGRSVPKGGRTDGGPRRSCQEGRARKQEAASGAYRLGGQQVRSPKGWGSRDKIRPQPGRDRPQSHGSPRTIKEYASRGDGYKARDGIRIISEPSERGSRAGRSEGEGTSVKIED